MARINLLPWREELRKQQNKDFIAVILLFLGITLAVLFFWHLQMQNRIEYQKKRNQFLQTEISRLDQQIKEISELEDKKNKFLAKMDVIQQLQSSRPEIVHLFEEISATVPEGIYLTKFIQSGKKLSFSGVARANARVSLFMRNLESSPWLKNPHLEIIETSGKENQRMSLFKLTVDQASKPSENEDKR